MKASDYRAAARQTLSGNWGPAVIVSLVYIAIVASVSCTTSLLTISHPEYYERLNSLTSLINIFIILPLGFALIIVFYNFAKDKSNNSLTANLFTLFKSNYRNGLPSMFLMSLFIGLICVIPMIIAAVIACIPFYSEIDKIDMILNSEYSIDNFTYDAILIFVKFILLLIPLMLVACIPAMVYAYRIVLFPIILFKDPKMNIMKSFRRSAGIMRGHKWQLFCLDISFIGWYILGILSLGIGLFWVIPYHETARSHFYIEMLKETEFAKEDTTEEALAE